MMIAPNAKHTLLLQTRAVACKVTALVMLGFRERIVDRVQRVWQEHTNQMQAMLLVVFVTLTRTRIQGVCTQQIVCVMLGSLEMCLDHVWSA